MKQSWLLVAVGVLGLVACAKAKPGTVDKPDGGKIILPGADMTGLDLTETAPSDLLKLAGFGQECTVAADCDSLLCYRVNPTDTIGHCTRGCKDDCPTGYACETVRIDNGTENDICIPAKDTICNKCSSHRDCGDDSDMCIDIGGAQFCSINCAGNPGVCPFGFVCTMLGNIGELTNVQQCVPTNNICCIDKDGDGRGKGDGCITTDCDDSNPKIYDDAVDICDGLDNDCKNGVDDMPINCKASMCQLGAFGYFSRGAEPCTTGMCVMQAATDCALYTCSGGGETGDTCATSCDVEDNKKCIPTAHCDASVCYSNFPDGNACDESSDCTSDHCQNKFCCAGGDCCSTAPDCPGYGSLSPVCDDAATCQGTRGAILCNNFRCGTQDGVADDTACTTFVEANACGFFRSVFCTGTVTQTPPNCATTCASNIDCDDNGWCDPSTSQCVGDLDNGKACGTDDARCISGHCQNGFCCGAGDCCAEEDDCPASYTSPPSCTVPTACQGQQDIARCTNNQCATEKNIDNDAACTSTILADDCGSYLPIYCSGTSSQAPPVCPTHCNSDADCDAAAYCNASGACVPDEPNGNACKTDAQCNKAHCQNNFCCDSGDCCAVSANCAFQAVTAQCMSQSTCQGTRTDGVCSSSFQCVATVVQDDSACAGLQSNDCGVFPAVNCTNAQDQPVNQMGRCATSCTDDNGCDVSGHCSGGTCVPDQGQGGGCSGPSDCGSGLFCVDHVCCNSSCTGTCAACDVPGKVGTCSFIPDGTDPSNECPAVGCSGYYAGFTGSTCYRKSDVTAANATCNGGGACRTAAVECTNQTARQTFSSCNATCQSDSGCTGTTGPTCNNINTGFTTCGNGACQRTLANCANGAPQACTADLSKRTSETCNRIDDDCDGLVDDNLSSDIYEPNSSCSSYRTLGTVGSMGTLTYTNQTLYPASDTDVYQINATETDSSCACCDFFCTDEDYTLAITLTVPAGAGSYRFCSTGACASLGNNCATVNAGTSYTWTYGLDGGCPGNDSYSVFVSIGAGNSPGYSCSPYTLSYHFTSGVCGY